MIRMMKFVVNKPIVVIALLCSTQLFGAATTLRYRIMDRGSEAVAKVAFMGLASKSARFSSISGNVLFAPADLNSLMVDVAIDATKLRSSDAATERELKARNFFWVDRYPTVSFKSTRLVMKSNAQGVLTGNLTARGITNPVNMAVTFSVPPSKVTGEEPLKLTGTAVINRQAFGMNAYSGIVGKKVTIAITAILKNG